MPVPDGGPIGFPATRDSVVAGLGSDDAGTRARAGNELVAAYWRPAYKYLRVARGIPHHDAEDLTQEFFARVLERDTLASYDPEKARFRTFLRVCLDRFALNEIKAAGRKKRGGALRAVPLDFASVERELGPDLDRPPDDPDAYFRREWIRGLFESALARLEEELSDQGKTRHYRAFLAYDVEPSPAGQRPTYEAVGALVGMTVTQVTNALFATRRAFRRLVLERLRELTGSEAEFREEAREILGVDP